MRMADTIAIVLAAGLSRRMGARNKLLLSIGGMPMIRHMVMTYFEATQNAVCVVTGHEADKITQALHGAPVTIHNNPDYANGQASSVACGLRGADNCDRLFIGLGDQPNLTTKDLAQLLDRHANGDPSKIAIPQHDGQRGNPIVVPAGLRAQLLADPRAPGCKKFTRNHPEHVQFHALPNPGFYADIDTPEAYQAVSESRQEVTT